MNIKNNYYKNKYLENSYKIKNNNEFDLEFKDKCKDNDY
jgi:hypothetical protein